MQRTRWEFLACITVGAVALMASRPNAQGAAAQRTSAQTSSSDDVVASAIASWIHIEAPPGSELHDQQALDRALKGWHADAFGNFVKRVGSGLPRSVVACAMDVPNFVVSQITDDGFVRVHRTGVAAHPLWDQFHEAQQVHVHTARGDVTGVVAIANGHFARQHRADTAIVTVDQLWIDLGVNTRAQAESLGVALLDPVLAVRPVWTYEGFAAGPAAGARASCAAVASAAEFMTGDVARARGEMVFVLSAQRSFGWVGLGAVVSRLGRVDQLTLFDEGRAVARTSSATMSANRLGNSKRALARTLSSVMSRDSVTVVTPRVRFAGTLVESVHADDARMLLSAAMSAVGRTDVSATWIAPSFDTTSHRVPRRDAFEDIDRTFLSIADIAGVPGHEWRVRDAIMALLPAWAKSRAVIDSSGNIVIAAGPDKDSVAFLAHMDEVSFEVEAILSDGRVRLRRMGGPVVTAWEGQPAMLHFDRDAAGRVSQSLRGVFVPRDSARSKPLANVTAWFGTDSAGLVSRGVRIGSAITAYKHATRLAGTRLTGRGSDDRTGSTALLLAMRRIDPNTLTHKAIFVFSTGEEGGLVGASAFGVTHGKSLVRVYSVDTFVSSDTPLELPTFAFVPLGRGAVMRGLDDGAITPRAERDRVLRIAKAHGIPVQVGTTHGATDGSSIAPFGAPNIGLSWPGRYSHAPGEVLDLRDVEALMRLIAVLARE